MVLFSADPERVSLPATSCKSSVYWGKALKQVGMYHEGVVDDEKALLVKHSNETITHALKILFAR